MPKFEVQTQTWCDGWVNCWRDIAPDGTETPSVYPSREKAQEAIDEFFADIDQAVADGDMVGGYDEDDLRIVEVGV